MLPKITFSDDSKVTMTNSDVESVVNSIKVQWAQRSKRPPNTLAYYDMDDLINKTVFAYLENKANVLAQRTDNKPRFYVKEMFAQGFKDNVRFTINTYLLNANVY